VVLEQEGTLGALLEVASGMEILAERPLVWYVAEQSLSAVC